MYLAATQRSGRRTLIDIDGHVRKTLPYPKRPKANLLILGTVGCLKRNPFETVQEARSIRLLSQCVCCVWGYYTVGHSSNLGGFGLQDRGTADHKDPKSQTENLHQVAHSILGS